jgi:hypothetical protein
MRTRLTLLTIFFCTSLVKVYGQPDSLRHARPAYFNNLLMGALLGKKELGASFTANTTHGVRYKGFSAGLGIGYDTFTDWRTMPVYASIGYDILKLKSRDVVFVTFTGGYSWVWRQNRQNDIFLYDAHGGAMIYPMMGYRVFLNRWSVYFSAGYKIQRIGYEQTPRWWGWETPGNRTTVDRTMSRFCVQFGLGLH